MSNHSPTAEQRERLEREFNECTHPDEDLKMQLSRELGLSSRQIHFWFRNRRAQLKAQEKEDLVAIYAEIDKLQRENNVLKEALKHMTCLSCKRGKPISFHLGYQGIADGMVVPTGSTFGKSNNNVLDSNDSTRSKKL